MALTVATQASASPRVFLSALTGVASVVLGPRIQVSFVTLSNTVSPSLLKV